MNISTNIDIQLLFDSHMYLMNISYQYRYTTTIWQPHILNSDTNGVPTHAPQHHPFPRHANSWLTAKKANTCARTGKLHGLCERLTSLGLIWAPLNPSIPQCRDARDFKRAFNWALIMPRDASPSDGCTPDVACPPRHFRPLLCQRRRNNTGDI